MLLFNLAALAAKFPLVTLSASFAIAFAAIILLTPFARRMGWVDKPDSRKHHEGDIPLIGGWGVLLAIAGAQLLGPADAVAPAGYWTGALLLFVVALVDDRYPVRARYRILVQFVAAIAGISLGGQALPNLGNLLGMGVVSAWWIVVPVSIFGTIAVINAMNFTDGVDGLCGGLGFISLFWFLIAVAISTSLAERVDAVQANYAQSLISLAAAVMGSLAAFLCFNMRSPWRKQAAVFMGDSGSMLIGFTLAWLAIHVASAFGSVSVSPVACLWIMAVPLADSASCFARRMLAGVRPTTPDLRHLHHLLMKSGMSVSQAVATMHAGSFVCGLVGVGGWWLEMPDYGMFVAFIVALLSFMALTIRFWERVESTELGPQVV